MTPVSFEAILISVVPSFTEAVKQERALFQAAHLADAEEAVALVAHTSKYKPFCVSVFWPRAGVPGAQRTRSSTEAS
eukprot:scaffold88855_cov86-Phaeocystis_antarctica.AAC.1